MIQTEVRDRLTDEILFGALENGGTVTIGLSGDELTFEFEAKLPEKQEPVANRGEASTRRVRTSTASEFAGAERGRQGPRERRR